LLLPQAKAGNSIAVKYAKGNFATEFSITWIENGEILFATSALAVDAYRSELEQTSEGRDFLDVYDKFMIAFAAYQGGKIVAGLPEAFAQLKSTWAKYGKQIPVIDNEIATLEKEIEKFAAKVKKVPSSLTSKLTQNGAAKLENWLAGKALSFVDETGNVLRGANAEAKILTELENSIGNKTVLEVLEDGQGRFSVVLSRQGQTNQVVSIHTTSNGNFKVTVFDPAYNPNLNPSIKVPLSQNKLAPDYANTQYLYPTTQGKKIRIEMQGNRPADFKVANEIAGFGSTNRMPTLKKTDGTVIQYTWHHLDDFEIINGKAYCSMQLVESKVHQGAGVTGMAHSGSVAQWKAFYGSGY
jgi:hypothetical protein